MVQVLVVLSVVHVLIRAWLIVLNWFLVLLALVPVRAFVSELFLNGPKLIKIHHVFKVSRFLRLKLLLFSLQLCILFHPCFFLLVFVTAVIVILIFSHFHTVHSELFILNELVYSCVVIGVI